MPPAFFANLDGLVEVGTFLCTDILNLLGSLCIGDLLATWLTVNSMCLCEVSKAPGLS